MAIRCESSSAELNARAGERTGGKIYTRIGDELKN